LWWKELIGTEPEQSIADLRRGEKRDSGFFQNNRLNLHVSRNKFAWVYQFSDQALKDFDIPVIGSFLEEVPSFRKLIVESFKKVEYPILNRVAFGCVLLVKVNNEAESLRLLQRFIPNIKLDPHDSSDFFYQINRRRISTVVPELKINRLSKWSTSTWSLAEMSEGRNIQTATTFCQLELDVNTVPDYAGELDPDVISQVFSELIDYAIEISEKGDVP
jgi:hypothetical protein